MSSKVYYQKIKRHPKDERKYSQITLLIKFKDPEYKEHLQLNYKKKATQFLKWAKNLKKHFSRKDLQIANSNMKRCSKSVVIKKMQIKVARRYHFEPMGMATTMKKKK